MIHLCLSYIPQCVRALPDIRASSFKVNMHFFTTNIRAHLDLLLLNATRNGWLIISRVDL